MQGTATVSCPVSKTQNSYNYVFRTVQLPIGLHRHCQPLSSVLRCTNADLYAAGICSQHTIKFYVMSGNNFQQGPLWLTERQVTSAKKEEKKLQDLWISISAWEDSPAENCRRRHHMFLPPFHLGRNPGHHTIKSASSLVINLCHSPLISTPERAQLPTKPRGVWEEANPLMRQACTAGDPASQIWPTSYVWRLHRCLRAATFPQLQTNSRRKRLLGLHWWPSGWDRFCVSLCA